jgi:biopolymer transport protein ExbD/biopolymer transport protein TolR
MPKTGFHKRRRIFADINITPLTDIFLVLLTIMMVMAPFVRNMRSDIALPDITAGTEVKKNEVTVDVTKDGKYFINAVEVPGERLSAALRDKGAGFVTKKLVVQADRDAKSGAVLQVFRAAEQAQYDQMTVLGQAVNSRQEEERDETPAPGTVR